jgi:hypothetical protein
MKPILARLVLLAALLSGAGAWAGPAGATPAPGLGIDPTYGPPLTIVKLTGTGFCPPPCGAVQITISFVRVDSSNLTWHRDGTFTILVQVPGSARPGSVPVVASQTDAKDQQLVARTSFQLTVNVPAPTHYPTPKALQPPGGAGSVAGSTPRSRPVSSPAISTPHTKPTTTPALSSAGSSSAATLSSTAAADQRSGSGSDIGAIAGIVAAGIAAAAAGAWWYRRRRAAH